MANSNHPTETPAQTPATTQQGSSCDFGALQNIVNSAGLVNFDASCRNGELTVTGVNQHGQQVRINQYNENGYTEGTLSQFQPTTREARVAEAKRLYDSGNGLSQTEIGKRLGVSQKTVCNDLRR